MWNAEYCVSWLQERYEGLPSREVPAETLYKRFLQEGGHLDKKVLGKYIGQVFNDVRLKRRYNSSKCKDELFYEGLSGSSKCNSEYDVFDLTDVKQWVPSPFFVSHEDTNEVQISMLCDSTINGNKIIKKIVLKSNNTWELYIADCKLNLKDYNIQNTYVANRQCIQNLCSIAFKIKLCHGKEKENTDNINVSQHVVEYLGVERNEIYRSKSCKRALPFLFTSNSCRNCNSFKRKSLCTSSVVPPKMSLNETPEKPVPSTCIPPVNKRNNDSLDSVVLQINDNNDMKVILEKVLPDAPKQMIDMLLDQKKNLEKNPYGRRWDKKTIRLCLSLWCRSKKNYQVLKDSKVLILPSKETLRIHKNSVDQKAGFNPEVFKWMVDAAKSYKADDNSMNGGIAIDEMSIQEDLCMVHSNGEVKLVGFVDMGDEVEALDRLFTSKSERVLATHVLQFVYMGLNGFRFPFACFPVSQANAVNLHLLFWRAVQHLNMYGFKVSFISMDGAQANRDFIKLFFKDSTPAAAKFSTKNIWFPSHPPITFIMDYSHVIKRIRNNILKSGDNKTDVRRLQFHNPILWEHWINAFKWDRDTNSFPIHYKLTNDHLYLNQQSKMRNKLAEDVLDSDMLYLMQTFQKALGDTGYILDDTICLLKATSTMVTVFRDRRPITDTEDIRLEQLNASLQWFDDWEAHIQEQDKIPSASKERQLISHQTREDIKSCIIGFTELCKNTLSKERYSIVPARINSDVIENVFCQQRGIINGNNTNPTFYQFVKNTNAVIIGQSTISKSSNTGSGSFTPICYSPPKNKINKSTTVRKPLSTLNLK